jgi:deoxycytidylate deaminase
LARSKTTSGPVSLPHIKDLTEFDYPNSELVFGFVCPTGTNFDPILQEFKRLLKKYRYTVEDVHLSNHLKKLRFKLEDEPEWKRIETRMNAAREACEKADRKDLMALAAVAEIAGKRNSEVNGSRKPKERVAHLLVSLKRPEEVSTLRKIYGPGFYLIGIFATEEERLGHLISLNTPRNMAEKLIERDQYEVHIYGQKTQKTFHLSDVFVRTTEYKQELDRFLQLIFCYPYVTPTPQERGMFFAYAASMRSAQLGRQVGACLVAEGGEDLLSVGCNDVPKAVGGLYWPDPNARDQRDHILGHDSNDEEIADIQKRLLEEIRPCLEKLDKDKISNLRSRIKEILGITEFGRAVHAEMDALLGCARIGISTRGTTLYTTTFPCHNCTRHIIAAGISEVYYIEPYPKSRAKELHGNEIIIEESSSAAKLNKQSTKNSDKVYFKSFIGIGPRRFVDLFSMSIGDGYELERKKDGKIIAWEAKTAIPRVSMRPTSYLQREMLAEHLIVNKTRSPEE